MGMFPEPGPSYVWPKTIKCPECFKPLTADDAYGHDCEAT